MPDNTLTERLVDKVLALGYEDLPQQAVDMAKHAFFQGVRSLEFNNAFGSVGDGAWNGDNLPAELFPRN